MKWKKKIVQGKENILYGFNIYFRPDLLFQILNKPLHIISLVHIHFGWLSLYYSINTWKLARGSIIIYIAAMCASNIMCIHYFTFILFRRNYYTFYTTKSGNYSLIYLIKKLTLFISLLFNVTVSALHYKKYY